MPHEHYFSDAAVTVLDFDCTLNSGQTYSCTIRPGDTLDEDEQAITIKFGPRVPKDAKGNKVKRAGKTVVISRSQIAMLSKRDRDGAETRARCRGAASTSGTTSTYR